MPKGSFSQYDPFGFSAAYLSVGNLFSIGFSVGGHPASGNLWVNLPRATVARLQGQKKLVIGQVSLNKANGRSFEGFFRNKSNNAQIPWILGPLSLLPGVGTAITIATFTVDGFDRLAAGSVNSDQLAVLMADGGAFIRTLSLEGTDEITAAVLYSVKVGNEPRMFGICSSTYGLNVVG